jgi:hypothetical protein
VESITSIGNSTKRDDITQIGKFGVGFKAVFSYTNTPAVHSGDFSFEIHDLIVPEQITPFNEQTKITIFEFPFNNPKKLAPLSTQEIEKGLCALSDNTLLFLSHIRKIDYTLPAGSHGSIQRIKRKDGRTEIHANHPHNEPTVSHWLHFEKCVQVKDGDGKSKTCRVAIAYQLEQNTGKNKDQSAWKIVAVTGGGQVSIYFPAEKETSKLHFHLHAPFASTVARDSVRDCPANEHLRDHIAELIVESLTAIRDQGWLNMSFLAVLPNKRDDLAKFYEPIRLAIVDAFKNQSLTPSKSGTHLASTALYRGANKISDVISDDDLSKLTSYDIPLWAANAPQRNQREDNFLDSLEIDKWDFEQLSAIFKTANKEKIESWLTEKQDDWMMSFYELLVEAKEIHDKRQPSWQKIVWDGLSFPLVRVESEQGVKHIIGNQAYFAPEDKNILPSADIDIVKRTVYSEGKANDEINQPVKMFLEKIGVKPFDAKAAIELRLKRYQSPPKQVDNEYYEDIKQFINYWAKNREEKTLFQAVTFLLGKTNNKLYWQKATDICLDSPFIETGLAELIEIHQKKSIWQSYSEKLTESELNNFVEFSKAIGVMHELEVIKLDENDAIKNFNNPYRSHVIKRTGFAEDYSIPELEKYLAAKKVSASRLIWNALIKVSKYPNRTLASFKPNQQYQSKQVDSQLIYHLKNHAWIPNKAGEFCTPQASTRETLHPDFPFNDSNGLLTAIEFGKEEKERAEALSRQAQQANWTYQSKVKTAQDNGFDSPEEMEEMAELLQEAKAQGKSLSELRAFLSPPNNTDFSDDISANPERRAGKVRETANDAPERRTEIRERTVPVDNAEIKPAAKAYLRDRYTKADKILYCQICKQPMPFKLVDGSYYFEAVELLKTDKRHKENHLALCPTDAAKFLYANESKDTLEASIHTLITRTVEDINNSQDQDNTCEIKLAGKSENLNFSPVHLQDLKAIFSSSDFISLQSR